MSLFVPESCAPRDVSDILRARHYLGPTSRGIAWQDDDGVIVLAAPTSRKLPTTGWFELTRWCLYGHKNGGSRQWSRVVQWLRRDHPKITTVVSYSDPSAGHSGALYRACNWWWAPTWQRLRPPPSQGGSWDGVRVQAVKDRWVFALRPDVRRVGLMTMQDDSILRRHPWARYCEPGGADYRTFRDTFLTPTVSR